MASIVILAGGIATRLKPMSEKIAKSMTEIAGKPFIHHQLELIKKNGIENVVICTGFLGNQIENYIKDGSNYELKVKYSYDGDKLLGTGGAVKKSLPLLEDIFFIIYGDSYLDIEYKPALDYFLSHQKLGLMTVLENNNKWDKSNVIFKNGEILEYDKKSSNPDMNFIDYGLGILRKDAFKDVDEGKFFDISDLYNNLINSGNLLGFEVNKRFYEIGSFEGIAETEKYILSTRISKFHED